MRKELMVRCRLMSLDIGGRQKESAPLTLIPNLLTFHDHRYFVNFRFVNFRLENRNHCLWR